MIVRSAREEDIPAVAALERECFPEGAAEPFLRELAADPARGEVIVAVKDDLLLGYAWFQSVLDEGYVGNVAVAKPYRRLGVGTALTEAMLRQAWDMGLSFLTLEVRQSNQAATGLYERCGFRTVGVRKDYYEKPREDAVLMTVFREKEE